MRAFEIHTYQNGRWKIDSVFDDKELALFEAKRMEDSARFSGVRVVEEAFDENNNKTSARTIYRGSKADQSNQKDLKANTQARQEVEIERRRATPYPAAQGQEERVQSLSIDLDFSSAGGSRPWRALRAGASPRHALSVAAVGAPFLFRHPGELLIPTCNDIDLFHGRGRSTR